MKMKDFLNSKISDNSNSTYKSDPELIRKNAKELIENKNFQAVMEALSDK